MLVTQLLHLSLVFATVLCSESPEREVHRLVGGHLKIVNSGADDVELLEADSSGSKEKSKKSNSSNGGDEEKKTLAQQVVEGKYGLIQKELFKKPLKQPGIISYDANPEIPKDNINNLGGLSKEDIWLAENHLLVINGGTYPKYDNKHDNNDAIWPAIDNYTAPKRPVKIPSHPKVPPPFPVQLTEDGPLQILGTNSSTTLEGPPSIYALPLPDGGYVPGTGPFFPQYPDPTNPASGELRTKILRKLRGKTKGGHRSPVLKRFFAPFICAFSPGAVAVLPPPSINEVDEDDPSIYYPPPYSFLYPSKENSSLVPAGPLVPGIILPPPPDFFAPLDLPTTKKTKKRPIGISKRPKIPKTTEQSPQIHPTTTPISPTSVINITLRKPIKVIPNNPTDINNELKPFIETTTAKKNQYESTTRSYSSKTRIPSRPQIKRPAVTKLKPVKSFAPHRTYYNDNSANGKPFAVYGPPETTTTPKTMISSTQVPLTHYYSTSDDINLNVVTIIPEKNTAKPAQYYYYEEEPQTKSITTTNRPNKIVQNFFNLPDHYYETPRQLSPYRNQYVYVTPKPLISVKPTYNSVQKSRNPDSFRQHLSQLKKQIQYYTSPRPSFREIQSPRPVYQYSFQAANYKAQNQFRPSQPETQSEDEEGFRPMPKYSVQIQPAIEIPSSQPIARNPIYFKQTFRATTEPPYQSQSYYSTTKPNYNYQENVHKKGRTINRPQSVAQYTFQAAPVNQDYRGYYTSPGNNYYNEENNKFSTFGQRIPSRTTPTPSVRYSTRAPNVVYVTGNANAVRQQNPISLEHDTLVNYLNPRPNINPDAEYISVKNAPRENYPQVVKFNQRPIQQYNINQQQGNFNRRPQIVNALPINVPNEEKGSFISYSLPGDNGAHFYFLTPQLAQSRDQGAGFYYSQNDKDRIRRNSDNNKT